MIWQALIPAWELIEYRETDGENLKTRRPGDGETRGIKSEK
jgi:hypothetical protein